MKDFLKDENLTQEEKELLKAKEKEAADEVKYEENDNWEFEAEAHTLNSSVLENDEFEIVIPKAEKDEKVQEPVEKPSAKSKAKSASQTKPYSAKANKGDRLLFGIVGAVVAIVLAACIATGVLYYTVPSKTIDEDRLKPADIAMTVGDIDISLGMYSYYYSVVTNNYTSQAGYSNNLNVAVPFDQQTTEDENGNEITWQELFDEETKEKVKYIISYYEKGEEEGISLTAEQKQSIEESLQNLEDYAKEEGKTLDSFISDNYGSYCSVNTLELMLKQCYIAENYYQKLQVESRATPKEEEAYFEKDSKKNYKNYLSVDAALLQLSYTPGEESEQKQAIEKAKKYIKSIKSVDDMKKLIPTVYKDEIAQYVEMGYAKDADECAEMIASTMKQTYCISMLSESQRLDASIEEWLLDTSAKKGSVKYFDVPDDGVVYILLKDSNPTLDESKVYSVRHILITPESEDEEDEDEEQSLQDYTKAQWKTAYNKAQQILDEYNNGAKTEYSFALLAEKYSDDTASTVAGGQGAFGGTIFGVAKGEMVKEFENWALDESRKYGDVDIIKSQFGYHIMYFVETDKAYLQYCESPVNANKEEEFLDGVKSKAYDSRIKKVQKTLAIVDSDDTSASGSTDTDSQGTEDDVAEAESSKEDETE